MRNGKAKEMMKIPAQCRSECREQECGQSWIMEVEGDQLLPGVQTLWEQGYFLEDVTCSDFTEGFQLIYHFAHWDTPGRVSLKCFVDHDNPRIPSIATIFKGANWHERECADFFGISFEGHPNPLPLLLPPEANFHPLVKEPSKRQSVHKVIPFCQMVACDESVAEESERKTTHE
ncbi:MAG: NADH-quinone oxidoreductase subunit C [Desulfovibrionales bacterium]